MAWLTPGSKYLLALAMCCREWTIAYADENGDLIKWGHCGICGEKPVITEILG